MGKLPGAWEVRPRKAVFTASIVLGLLAACAAYGEYVLPAFAPGDSGTPFGVSAEELSSMLSEHHVTPGLIVLSILAFAIGSIRYTRRRLVRDVALNEAVNDFNPLKKKGRTWLPW